MGPVTGASFEGGWRGKAPECPSPPPPPRTQMYFSPALGVREGAMNAIRISLFCAFLGIPGGGGGGYYKLEFLQFKFCTKILYAICSVFLRICAGNNNKRPLFLMSNHWEPYIICSLIFKTWHRICRTRICRFIFPPARNPRPPITALWREIQVVHSRPTQATRGLHTEGKEETGVDRRLLEWRNTNVPPGTRQSLPGAGSGRLCVGTGGKDMGTSSVYCGRRDTVDDSVRLMAN